ncbi:MAG: CBS domain-containing protein [Candidatus Nitrosopolaris sp.]
MNTATVGDFMTRRVETISAASSVQEATKKMKDKDISSLVVVDDRNKPLGLITERDIVRKVASIYDSVTITSMKNADILSFPLITVRSDSSPEAAADLLIENKIRHLLVVDKEDADKPVGVITPMDFTRYKDSRKSDSDDDPVTRILEYYRD